MFKIKDLDGVEREIPITILPYNTFLKRLKGLMFRVKPIREEGILLKPCNSIHMFFMFFAIDVVFVNEENEIVYLKEHVKPWTVVWPVKGAVAAIELPTGTISNYSIKTGATIKM
ncbi:DUF192 domain-containing protein [Bacillus alkalisoli]|uniref:DUF192 domain-containing protein n=1 Tax=Bacillus alkalisoli TaxID=2011008 RepID=UPI000C247775|nr:DUF192 domain-containing protein [Bacillus alkalisoli]